MNDREWHRVADETALQAGEPMRVDAGGEQIALFRVDGSVYATHDICTHAYASLAEGFQEGEEIECPLHEGRFNVKSGKALCAPVSEDLRVFETKIEDGGIFVRV